MHMQGIQLLEEGNALTTQYARPDAQIPWSLVFFWMLVEPRACRALSIIYYNLRNRKYYTIDRSLKNETV